MKKPAPVWVKINKQGFDRQDAVLPTITSAEKPVFAAASTLINGYVGAPLNSQLLATIGNRRFDNAMLGLTEVSDTTARTAAATQISTDRTRVFNLPGAADGPGFAYIDTLIKDLGATYNPISLRDNAWNDKQVRLTPAFQALLSVAVGYFTGGAGLGITGVFQKAALDSLITGAIGGAITGNFDMEEILKGALLAGSSAYVSNFVTQQFNLGSALGATSSSPFINDVRGTFAPQMILDRLGDQVVSAGISNVFNGRPFFADIENLGRTFLVTESLALVQFGIGEMGNGMDTRWEGSIPHMLLHGGVGCIAIEALRGNCASGFFAGVSQSVLAGSNLTDAQKLQLAPLVGSLAGFLWADGQAVGVNFGGTIAQSGLVNNYLTHADVAELKADLKRCSDRNGGQCPDNLREEIILKYRLRSNENDKLLVTACARSMECVNERLNQIASNSLGEWNSVDPYVTSALSDVVQPGELVTWHQLFLLEQLPLQQAFAQARCNGTWNAACADAYQLASVETLLTGASVAAGAGLGTVAIRALVAQGSALCARLPACWAQFLGREVSAEVLAQVSAGGFTASGGLNLADDIARQVVVRYPGTGAFRAVNESMSVAARAYQDALPGAVPGRSYIVGGVRFDSFDPGIGLLEAKAGYGFMFDSRGELLSWARSGYSKLLDQAARQSAVAGNVPVYWYVQTPALRERLMRDFAALGINVTVRQ